jgi:hypothetical protein
MTSSQRTCLREPIPAIGEAARLLESAVQAHLAGNAKLAHELIRGADLPAIREWTESLWGSNSPYVQYRPAENAPPSIPKEQRVKLRMPTTAEKNALHERDGFHCRFCGIPLIRKEIRERIKRRIPRHYHGDLRTSTNTPHFRRCGCSMITSLLMLVVETIVWRTS